jgi:hypothetical protein
MLIHCNAKMIRSGLPPSVDMSEFAHTTDSDELQRLAALATMSCYICRRHIGNGEENKINLGIPFRVCPTEITYDEKKAQSDAAQRERNVDANPTDEYDPYGARGNPTWSVKPWMIGDHVPYLHIEALPAGVFLCCDCRRAGQAGDRNIHLRTVIPPPAERGMINKFQQRNYAICGYYDGNWHPITDRLNIILTSRTANLRLIKEQLSLAIGRNTQEEANPKTLASDICLTIGAILRTYVNEMFKRGNSPEIGDFEQPYMAFLRMWRVSLELCADPAVREEITANVITWNMNPFNEKARSLFKNPMDVLFVLPLCGLSFNVIKRQYIMVLISKMFRNFEHVEGKDPATALRQLFNEGRNVKLARASLYVNCFLSFATGKNIREIIKLMDDNYGSLPFSMCINVWKQIQLCTDTVTNLCPDANGPGLFGYLGMTNPNADPREHVENTYRFVMWVQANEIRWMERISDSPDIARVLDSIQIGEKKEDLHMAHKRATEVEAARRAHNRRIHSGIPLAHPQRGAWKLTDCECGYDGCRRQFADRGKLLYHLRDAWRDDLLENEVLFHQLAAGYCPQFNSEITQRTYESQIPQVPLTPEIVREQKITRCPSQVCEMHDREFNSPEDLINHFERYGIIPFWKEGMTFSAPIQSQEKPVDVARIWAVIDECVVCLDAQVNCVFTCGHAICCMKCSSSLNICPLCRTEGVKTLPLMM